MPDPAPPRTPGAIAAIVLTAATTYALTPPWGGAPLVGVATGLALALRLSGAPAWVVLLALPAGAASGDWETSTAGVAGAFAAAAWIERQGPAGELAETPAGVVRFLAASFTAALPAGLAAAAVAAQHSPEPREALIAGSAAFLGQALGLFTVAPAMLLWRHHGRPTLARVRRHAAEVLAGLAIAWGCLWLFFGHGVLVQPGISLVVVWLAFRTRAAGGPTLLVAIVAAICLLTASGAGPASPGGVQMATLAAQLRLLAQSAALLFFQALLLANDRHLASLQAQNHELETLAAFKAGHAERLEQEVAARTADLERAMRAAEASNEAKSQFLANVSHELRTPLSALLGFGRLLGEGGPDDATRRGHAADLERNGRHLLALIDDLLELVEGPGSARHEALALDGFIEDLALRFGPRARERGLGFTVTRDGALPAAVYTDPPKLRRVVASLVDNALKFTTEGDVGVRVGLGPGDELHVTVTDTGPGITPTHAERIFLPFEQADGSPTRRVGGAGVGLALARAIAEGLGGRLTLEATSHAGSAFRLVLPVEVPADPSAVDPHARVLLAEDGPDNRALLVAMLRRLGVAPDVVEDGRQAVGRAIAERAAGRPYDLVLLDIQMPELDGYGAARELRAAGWTGPIVALTANGVAGERERCEAAGFDRHLAKPVSQDTLRGLLPGEPAITENGSPLESSMAGDPDFDPIITSFVGNLGARLDALREAAAGDDPAVLRRLAHQLKGAAGGYGFMPITGAAGRLELASPDDVERELAELAALCSRARPPAGGS